MTKKNLFLFLFITASIINVQGQIHLIHKMKEVSKYLISNKRRLVIFDIDNVLLNPKTDLGSDQWVSFVAKQNMTKGLSVQAAYDQILPLYFHVSEYTDLITTEPNLAKKVKEIEQKCDHVICLTARSLQLETKTLEQLTKNNLTFNVPEVNECELNLPNKSLYNKGVLFCGHNCKGIVLDVFLDAIGYTPDEIIFIDDKAANLHAVESSVEKRGIKFVGLRYAGCDTRIANFNIEEVNRELKKFLKVYPYKTN